MRHRRRAALLVALLVLTACRGETPPRMDVPLSLAALGDSITRAFLVCNGLDDCPESSWATGNDVNSHRRRLAHDSRKDVVAHNFAVSGATVTGLARQVPRAVEAAPAYVTILIGANDACATSEQAMTSLDAFTEAFGSALDALVAGLPDATVYVVSIPDLYRLWEVGRDRPEVRAVWQRFGICQSMLANAEATDPENTARRDRVREKVRAYNGAMAAACAAHSVCVFDGDAVFETDFDLDDLSDRDYWHPSKAGQERLAKVTWEAGPWS